MKMMNKFCALMLSVALCAGMAAPAFAYGGEPVEEAEQPVLTSTTDEEDAVTVTDEENGALTPEGNLTLVDDYHTSYSDGSGQRSRGRGGGSRLPQQGGKLFRCHISRAYHAADLSGFFLLNPTLQDRNAVVQLDAALLLFLERCPQLIQFFAHS